MRRTLTLGSTLLFLLFLAHPNAFSQSIGYQGGLHFLAGAPQGAFGSHVDNNGYGVNLFTGITFGHIPLLVGVEGGAMIYGLERREEPLSLTIPDVLVAVTTTNAFLLGHALVRLQPQTGLIRPYVDGFIGMNHLTTNTTVDHDDYDEYDDYAIRSNNINDTGMSYGTGGGVMIKVAESVTDEGRPFDVLLDFRVRYVIGEKVEYLRKGSIRRDLGSVDFDPFYSKTDALLFQVGMTLSF